MEETNKMLTELFVLIPMEQTEKCIVCDYIRKYGSSDFFYQYQNLNLSDKVKERIEVLKETAYAAILMED